MFFWKLKHRRKKRYMVFLNGLLKVRFPDFQDQLTVTVDNLSDMSATLHADRIFLNGRHLIALHQRPELNLRIPLPDGVFESKIEIRWYRWLTEKNIFEIGTRFTDILKENQLIVDKTIHRLQATHA